MSDNPGTQHGPRRAEDPRALGDIRDALRGMEHGKLTVVVQDGRIIQLERTDRVRLPRAEQP
ncbi:MAG: putative small protein [Armatimonadetes bacterium]|nr:putative small protein [Armatimonadota bacterium]